MDFRVLTAAGEDARLWSDLVRRLPQHLRDLHFLPEYGLIYHDTYGHEPLLAYGAEESSFIIQPFVRRRLDALPFLAEQNLGEPAFDIANAYGYGGPLCPDPDTAGVPGLMAAFEEQFRAWCVRERIASEFGSLHPLLDNRALLARGGGIEAVAQKRIVYLDLAQPEAALWQGVNRGHRSSIQRARNGGVRVERVAADQSNL